VVDQFIVVGGTMIAEAIYRALRGMLVATCQPR
jgi:hypothetical protein